MNKDCHLIYEAYIETNTDFQVEDLVISDDRSQWYYNKPAIIRSRQKNLFLLDFHIEFIRKSPFLLNTLLKRKFRKLDISSKDSQTAMDLLDI